MIHVIFRYHQQKLHDFQTIFPLTALMALNSLISVDVPLRNCSLTLTFHNLPNFPGHGNPDYETATEKSQEWFIQTGDNELCFAV